MYDLVAAVAFGHGVLRSILADRNVHPDIVPVDVVINLICAVARKTAMEHIATGMIPHSF